MSNKILNATSAILIVVCLLLAAPPTGVLAQRSSSRANRAPAAATRPKLVIVIMIDQFRYDYVERFWDLFGTDGFRRLVDDGAFFTNANFDYVPTVTAAGHAAVHTGSIPALNGIVGNAVLDRDTGRVSAIVADGATHPVTTAGVNDKAASASPRALIGTTIGDQLQMSNNFQSKVVAMSLKDRAAILPGGHRPNGAYWYNGANGEFMTSDYYTKELPAWVKKFNTTTRADKYFGAKWQPMLPAEAYKRAMAAHIPEQQRAVGEDFPYTINGGEEKPGLKFYSAFEVTPFASDYLADFAKAALDGEALGADAHTDLLAISFSSPDLAGHYYGPDSQEVEDTYLRLDRTLADFLQFVDRRVGLQNTIIAMTADHGVAPIPKLMESRGFDAQTIERRKIDEAVNQALKARFGGDRWVQGFVNEQIFLNRKQMAEMKVDPAEVERVAADAAVTVNGIVNAFTRTQIVEGRMPAGALARRVMNGYQRARGGDVWIITKPLWFVAEGIATTHGSPYHYDTHVPVIFYGAGIKAGRFAAESTPSDIAPTIAALLGIEAPSNSIGRVLVEAMQSGQAKAAGER